MNLFIKHLSCLIEPRLSAVMSANVIITKIECIPDQYLSASWIVSIRKIPNKNAENANVDVDVAENANVDVLIFGACPSG